MPPKHKKEDTGDREVMVSIEQYTKTRDAVIVALTSLQTGLAHVQSGLNDLLRTYMQHTSSILAGEEGDLDKLQLPANLTATANAAMEAALGAANGVSQSLGGANHADGAGASSKNKKRKREKKEKDPNAPKKPLTAAFLYAQTARPIVRADLEKALGPGDALEKNAVNLETTQRWNNLSEDEKDQWKQAYRDEMVTYKVKLEEYLKGKGEKITDAQLDDVASDDGEMEVEAEAGAVDSDASSDDDDDDPVAKAPSPPAKTPRANKRQKTIAATPAVNGLAVPAAPATYSTPVPLPGTSTVHAPTPSVEPPATIKRDRKKKEKPIAIAPTPIAPAPASEDLSPEEGSKTSKKAKSSRSTRTTEAEVDKENAATPSVEKEKKKRDRSKRKSEVAA